MKRITEWGFQKKIRRAEKEAMLRIERRRSAAGKRTSFRIRGQEVTAAKLKRAAVAVEEDEAAAAAAAGAEVEEVEQADTPSCISYGTPVSDAPSPRLEERLPNGEVPSVHTAAWASDPAEHFWKTRQAYQGRKSSAEEPEVIDDLPTYGVLNRMTTVLKNAMPVTYERNLISWYDGRMSETSDSDSSDDEEEQVEGTEDYHREIELYIPVSPPKPFKLRRFLTSTMPSLNYELRRARLDLRLEHVAGRPMIEPNPEAANETDAPGSTDDGTAADSGSDDAPEEDPAEHLEYFKDAVKRQVDDDVRNQHFSDVLGILKARYDRETATLNLMAMVFDDGEVVTEEQVRDKMEALIANRHRHHGYEAQTTLDACLAGVILMMDANRIDAEQQTWSQGHVRTRLDRVYQLLCRVFASRLDPDTVLELLGDAEAKDVTGSLPADSEGRAKAGALMHDIATNAMQSTTVLHALELLPRYHRQWSAWHLQERVREKPFLFTRQRA